MHNVVQLTASPEILLKIMTRLRRVYWKHDLLTMLLLMSIKN